VRGRCVLEELELRYSGGGGLCSAGLYSHVRRLPDGPP
jgi:hypothetical protein